MKNTLIKIAVLVLIIKEMWLLLGIPAVDNAVISFLTVGAIPGTNKTLTPDEVYKLVIVLFFLAGGLIFRKDLLQLFRRLRANRVSQISFAVTPIPHPLSLAGTMLNPGAATNEENMTPQRPQKLRIWGWRLSGIWLLFKVQMIRLAARVRPAMLHYMKLLAWYARFTAATLRRLSTLAGTFVVREIVIFWRFVEPYLRRFDSYLERKLHQYDQTATLLSIGNEMNSTIRKWREEYRTLRESDTQPRK